MSAIGYFLILDQPIRGKQRREGELICRIFLMLLVPGNDFQAWKISSQTAVMRADGKTGQYSVQQFMYPGLRISSVAATSIAVMLSHQMNSLPTIKHS
jgi:hypothetical protein